MTTLNISSNIKEVIAELGRVAEDQIPFATSLAINRTTERARVAVRGEMERIFDNPTPWVLNSLRVIRSTKVNLNAEVGFKDRNSVESSRSMIEPHVFANTRRYKAMEVRLFKAGLMPTDYYAVPGAGAKLDSFGNISRGQVSQLLNVLQTYKEAGFNKADDRTVARLAKGNAKKGVYGFVYWVNPVGSRKGAHLLPGVYQRIATPFGSSLKPVLIFVQRKAYKKTLNFFEISTQTFNANFRTEFAKALIEAQSTSRNGSQRRLF